MPDKIPRTSDQHFKKIRKNFFFVVGWILPRCAQSLDRRSDDTGLDGRVERVTNKIFHLMAPMMIPSHVLVQKQFNIHDELLHDKSNLMRIQSKDGVLQNVLVTLF